VPAPLGQGYIARTVKVTTERPKVFSAAIAANLQVNMSGGIVDSYSSCLGLYSITNNGLGTNGSVATNYKGPLTAIKLQGTNTAIYGSATTGPNGTISTTGGASVGDATWNATSDGVQSGWDNHDMNVAFPANQAPLGPFATPTTIIDGVTNTTVLASDTYILSSFSSNSSNKTMLVTGNATLYVQGILFVSGSGYIKIQHGASLTLYAGGNATTISGGGVINETGQPANLTYYGLPNNQTISISGSADFIGTINAPQAALINTGTGNIFGAAIVKSYSSSGGGSFHYDECLGKPGTYLTMTGWQEL
jgi:hypothetical protein